MKRTLQEIVDKLTGMDDIFFHKLAQDKDFCEELLQVVLVYCTVHISPNDLPEFPSAVLASIDDATASPHSAALQSENSFCVVWMKMNGTVH